MHQTTWRVGDVQLSYPVFLCAGGWPLGWKVCCDLLCPFGVFLCLLVSSCVLLCPILSSNVQVAGYWVGMFAGTYCVLFMSSCVLLCPILSSCVLVSPFLSTCVLLCPLVSLCVLL